MSKKRNRWRNRMARARKRLQEFSPRGSNCPICRREFRGDGCPHSVTDARTRLEEDVTREIVRGELAQARKHE